MTRGIPHLVVMQSVIRKIWWDYLLENEDFDVLNLRH